LAKPQTLAEAFEDICAMDAPLNERLQAYVEKLKELSFPFAEAYDDLVARLAAGKIGTEAPRPGELMPPFVLPSHGGKLVSLDELLAHGPLVIIFGRGHWCPFCKIEFRTIASHHEEIARHGAQVVSILPERQQFTQALSAETLNTITILSDIDNGYALSLGLVMWLGDRLKELMKGRGYQLETYQGNNDWFVPLPATYILDRDRRIIARHVDPEFRQRMDVDEIITALKAASTKPPRSRI
jgi:peroxiredoxin